MKERVFQFLTAVSFLYALGTVGAIEQNMVSLGVGTIKAFLAIGAFGLFSELGGLTYPSYRHKRRSRQRK